VKIADYKYILQNHSRVTAIIKENSAQSAPSSGDERRTAIENVSGEVDVESLIPVEDVRGHPHGIRLCQTSPATTYRSQNRAGAVFGHDQRARRTTPTSCCGFEPRHAGVCDRQRRIIKLKML
jgi:DNA gyrase subunit A